MTFQNRTLAAAVGLAFAAVTLIAAAKPAPRATPSHSAVQVRDWARVAVTTEYGWRIGHPAAANKLVEYAAMNCPHCAEFDKDNRAMIEAAVRSGRASYELRPFPIFALDPAATFIARCLPANRSLGFVHAYFDGLDTTRATLEKALADPARRALFEAAAKKRDPRIGMMLIDAAGIAPLAARFGIDRPRLEACVTSKANGAWLDKAYAAAQQAGVRGTPTLFLNGKPYALGTTADLKAALEAKAG